MYQRILVPMDGSPLCEQVLPMVRALANGLHPVSTTQVCYAAGQLVEVIEIPTGCASGKCPDLINLPGL
jgi:nucleotide-binding universal stress UspA family protein